MRKVLDILTNGGDRELQINEKPFGNKLYHYTSAEGLMGICDGEFWVTEKGFLNDYTEFQIAKQIFGEVFDRQMKNRRVCDRLKKAIADEIDRLQSYGLNKNDTHWGAYVISFCMDEDNPLMWSQYSDFKGYCMEFDYEKLMQAFDDKGYIQCGRVVYRQEEQVAILENVIESEFISDPALFPDWEALDCLTDSQIDDVYWMIAAVICDCNVFFKRQCFEEEHEYRICFHRIHDGGRCKEDEYVRQYSRAKDGVLIPFIKEPLKSLEALDRVIIGSKNKSDIAVKGLRHFFRGLKLDVEVEKSHIPLRY